MTITLNHKQVELDADALDNLFSDLADLSEQIHSLLNGDRTAAEVQQLLAQLNTLADVYS